MSVYARCAVFFLLAFLSTGSDAPACEGLSCGAPIETAMLLETRRPGLVGSLTASRRNAERAQRELGEQILRDARRRLNAGHRRTVRPSFQYRNAVKDNTEADRWQGAISGGLGQTAFEHYYLADIDMRRRDRHGTDVTVTASSVHERALVGGWRAGGHLGATLDRMRIAAAHTGYVRSWGAHLGAYVMRKLVDGVIVDGFVSGGALHQTLDVSGSGLSDVAAHRNVGWLTAGGSLSGRHDAGALSLFPEVSLSRHVLFDGAGDASATEGTERSRVQIDAARSDATFLSAQPRIARQLRGPSDRAWVLSPTARCEFRDSHTGADPCRLGLGLGFEAGFREGAGRIIARFAVQQTRDDADERLSFELTTRF